MSEFDDPDFSIGRSEYEGDQEGWGEILNAADYILHRSGTLRENGLVDTEWENDTLGRRFALLRRPQNGVLHYWLKFPKQISEVSPAHEPAFAFQEDITHVTGLFGEAAEMYAAEQSAERRFELAEIDLRFFLATHPEVSG